MIWVNKVNFLSNHLDDLNRQRDHPGSSRRGYASLFIHLLRLEAGGRWPVRQRLVQRENNQQNSMEVSKPWGYRSYHPFIDGFSMINQLFWGTPIYGTPHTINGNKREVKDVGKQHGDIADGHLTQWKRYIFNTTIIYRSSWRLSNEDSHV